MLDIEAFGQWLTSHGVTAHVGLNRQVRKPDLQVTLTSFPGRKSELEYAIQTPGLQIRSRGAKNDMKSARDLAHQIDRIMLDETLTPCQMGDSWLISIDSASGAPYFLNHDGEERTTYVTTYFVRIQR
jgi:hypothetical protein